jgi:hypothetical protein
VLAAYVEQLGRSRSAPSVKQHLAALRMLFDWLVVGQALSSNPASVVRGPKHVVRRGKTPVLSPEEARALFEAIPADTLVGLRDRALLGVLIYGFARISAALAMRVEDYAKSRCRVSPASGCRAVVHTACSLRPRRSLLDEVRPPCRKPKEAMMLKTLLTAASALALTVGAATAAPPPFAPPFRQPPFERPFAVGMVVGDPDIVVGSNGPFEVVARCFLSPASGLPRSRLLMRSSVDGWAITQASDPTRFNLFDLPAGEQPIGGITNSGPELGGALGASAVAPTGEVLTVDGGTVLVAMNILDDYDCVMTGVVTTLRVPITP